MYKQGYIGGFFCRTVKVYSYFELLRDLSINVSPIVRQFAPRSI